MAFSYYQTNFAVDNSAASISYSFTFFSSNTAGDTADRYITACPTQFYSTSGFGGGGTLNSQSDAVSEASFTSINGKSITYSNYLTLDAYAQQGGGQSSNSLNNATIYLNQSITTSDFPFKTFKHTESFSSSESFADSGGTTTNSGSSLSTGLGIGGATDIQYKYETFTFTSTYEIFDTKTTSSGSTVYFGSEPQSTTYGVVQKDGFLTNFKSGSFTSTRAYDFSFYTAPINISRSYNLEYFRPVEPNSLILYATPLIKVFTATESQALISDYDFLLNATISSSFSTAGLAQGVGASVNTQPTTTITLTTNGVSQVPQSSELVQYTYYPIEYGGKSFSFLSSNYTYQYDYDSFSETSSTYTYSIFVNINTSPYGTSYASSAYSRYQTILVETTTTYPDISCNSITYLVYTKSITINTTSSLLSATNIFLRTVGHTDYAYSSYQEIFLATGVRRPFNSYSFSSQKFLHGNFIKNMADETAYWSINLNTFGGIFDFSCQKIQGSDPYYTPVPKLFRFPNCYVTAPLDPISTTVLNVSINQSVSTNSLGTSISQTVYYESTSTTRTFDVHYEESVGTVASAVDTINNFDPVSNYGTSTLSPIAQIYFNAIFNTLGQLGQASYVADGAPFKQNSSEVSFASTTYTNPISVELYGNGYFYEQNSYSMFTVFTSDFGSPIVSETKSLQNFEIDPSA